MTVTIKDALAKARAAQIAGNLQEAERLYAAILRAEPAEADANHGMGTLALAVGKVAEAVPFFGAALKARPTEAGFWLSYIETLIKLDMRTEAKAVLDQASLQGMNGNPFAALAQVLSEGDATPETQKPLNNAQLNRQLKRAQKKAKAGDAEEAQKIYRDIIAVFPENKRALDGLAKLQGPMVSESVQGAELPGEIARELTELIEAGEFEAVLNRASALQSRYPRSILLRNIEGTAYTQLNQHQKAVECFRQALALAPDSAQTHFYLGAAQQETGDLKAAMESFEHALALDPEHVAAHCQLAALKSFQRDDPQIDAMRTLHQRPNLPEAHLCRLSFALSTAYDCLGDLDKAFGFLKQGNAIRKKMLGYSIEKDRTLFANIYKYHDLLANNPAKVNCNPDEITPIFILGMPRSGTTLVEQILSSHSQVGATGEVEMFGTLGTAITSEQSLLTEKTIHDFRAMYKAVLQKRAGGGRFITDKMPQNFRFTNLICKILPEAKIIHVERDPFATCWSNFAHNFVTDTLGYCYDIEDIADYYALYRQVMAFWSERYPERLYHLNYDALVNDQEGETRKLADHIGLRWEAALLRPEDNKRIARTASQQQVRQGVYKGSSLKGRKYAPYLNGAWDRLEE
nr:sulfotransferase [uncultured Cohaesibacter sp.]